MMRVRCPLILVLLAGSMNVRADELLPAAPVLAPGTAPASPDLVRVHLQTTNPNVILEGWVPVVSMAPGGTMVVGGQTFLAPAAARHHITCTAPCDQWLDRNGHYRIAGFRVTDTYEFGLPLNAGREISLEVLPGSAPMRSTGSALIATGVLAILTGVPIAIAGAVLDDRLTLRNAGLGVFAGGAALLGIGIPLVYLSNTKVRLQLNGSPVRLALSPRGLVF